MVKPKIYCGLYADDDIDPNTGLNKVTSITQWHAITSY